METLYGFKRKTINRWLKFLLLLFVAVGFGVLNLNAQTKAIKVANDQQLIEAMGNSSIVTIEFVPGYYAYLNLQADSETKVVKQAKENGSRVGGGCTYFIISRSFCFIDENPEGFVGGIADAGTQSTQCPNYPAPPDCCPGPDLGLWHVVTTPLGGAVQFVDDPWVQANFHFEVNMPGIYILAYEWLPGLGVPEYAYVKTEYYFFGPPTIELSADDVCGTSTLVTFTVESAYWDSLTVIEWFLNGDPYAGPDTSAVFTLEVDPCGLYTLEVVVTPTKCEPDSATIIIDFACQPIADAGQDVNVCDDICYYSLIGSYGGVTLSPIHAWSWVQLSGPTTLIFGQPDSLVTSVCGEADPECGYGEYEVQFQVQNGECSAEDEMMLRFYEMPTAFAGPDQNLCNLFSFSLAAVPYVYCGDPGVNYWKHAWWELVSQPGSCAVDFDEIDPVTNVDITNCEPACAYGQYIFVWHELNVKIDPVSGDTLWAELHCYDSDTVVVNIYEDPAPNAGPDVAYCETEIIGQEGTFTFALEGELDAPCSPNTAYTYHWDVVSQPDACDIEITPGTVTPDVIISKCAPCQYGVYVFSLTQSNGYIDDNGQFVEECSTTDNVSIFIYENPEDIDAGEDMVFCNTFAFTLYGIADEPCYENTVVIYSWEKSEEPGNCTVTFNDPDDIQPGVVISDCNDSCQYGEYIFILTQLNGYNDDAGQFVEVCSASDTVSVIIYEQPLAYAGLDVYECVDIADSPFCYSLYGTMDICYSMYGIWTKSCGPGEVTFDDPKDPLTAVCFSEPGRYIFTWTEWNAVCTDADTVIFDLLEQPTAIAAETDITAPCDDRCYTVTGIKYQYFGTDQGECPNFWDNAHWIYVSGPCDDPAEVTFAPDNDSAIAVLCVSHYGGYTIGWVEINQPPDKDYYCSDTALVFIEFYETPEPFAGDDATLCGNCYTLQGVQYAYLPPCNQHLADYYYWESLPGPCGTLTFSDSESLTPEVCIPDDPWGMCYGTYGFVLHESNGDCFGTDTVYITFDKIPDPVDLCYSSYTNECGPYDQYNVGMPDDYSSYGCLEPNEVLYVCANGWSYFDVCNCDGDFYPFDDAFIGWTFEWSVTGPAGTIIDAGPGYYDFEDGYWNEPWLDIYWGECCDTARIYLTITTPDSCSNTMEYKVYVYHRPCVDLVGPEDVEIGTSYQYCNECVPPNPCLLYTWEAVHCAVIESGQGERCINVHWTDPNINGGWGMVVMTVLDTCTGCCNSDTLMVKIWPTGTLGDATLAGHVYYHNIWNTPLDGVEIQLWIGAIPVMSTTSFNDVEGGNGVGYYEFTGISGTTPFVITASYDAPWYGANATDALAVQLKVINNLPVGFDDCILVEEAMDVNNSSSISATDALWIKQRAIAMVTYFPAGDWVFAPNMGSTAGIYDIYTLNAGDANRSNIPYSMKVAPAIDLVTDGTMNVVTGQVFELPIRIADASQFGAITLDLGYNSALIDIIAVVPVDGMLYNITSGNVSIAWSDVNPMVLTENGVVVTLKVKAISQFTSAESLFSIGLGSEFAGKDAKIIEPVTLKTFGITTEAAATDYFLSANRPNPFSNSTFIEYTMPETGKVKLSVLDMLGQEIAVLVEATQTAGSYTVEFSAAGLSTGVYIYKITVDGETRDFISTQRMVISH